MNVFASSTQPKRFGNCGWYFSGLKQLSENGLSFDVWGRLGDDHSSAKPQPRSRPLRHLADRAALTGRRGCGDHSAVGLGFPSHMRRSTIDYEKNRVLCDGDQSF
jgi:hypothetical protein